VNFTEGCTVGAMLSCLLCESDTEKSANVSVKSSQPLSSFSSRTSSFTLTKDEKQTAIAKHVSDNQGTQSAGDGLDQGVKTSTNTSIGPDTKTNVPEGPCSLPSCSQLFPMLPKKPNEPAPPKGSKPASLSLTELITMLATEQHGIRFDEVQHFYEITDGPMFVDKFNSLRCTRRKRRDEGLDRPFARMHLFFVLIRGDKWGATGSAFRAKTESTGQPPPRTTDPLPNRPDLASGHPLFDLFAAAASPSLAPHRTADDAGHDGAPPAKRGRPSSSDDSLLLLSLRGVDPQPPPHRRPAAEAGSFSDALCPPDRGTSADNPPVRDPPLSGQARASGPIPARVPGPGSARAMSR
jgi:hypothetical protein